MPSRLTHLETRPPEPCPTRVASHSFRAINGKILLTEAGGRHALLSPAEYERYLKGDVDQKEELGGRLQAAGLLRDYQDFGAQAAKLKDKHLLAWPGPSVHTIVVTLRCNFKCSYCHSSVVGESQPGVDMTVETARRTVDFAFQSPNPDLMLEFQGGEPLLNWPVVKFIVDYARLKNSDGRKKLNIGLISNFSLLDDQRLDFLASQGVSFCTSLDGPADLHNKNRTYLGGSGHAEAVGWINKIQQRISAGAPIDVPNAICTVTRHSLPRHREIIDQVVELGLERIQLGPLDRIGFAKRSWPAIGYTPDEFLDFYRRAVDYAIDLNQKGVKVYEKMALILLLRILKGEHWRFPNGDALCRLAYNHNGEIYTCEEGRLLANEGDPVFKIGHVASSSYAEVLEHPNVRASVLASKTSAQPMCAQCAYNPYCTVLPVFNYATQDNPWGQMPSNDWCRTMMGVFDYLFAKLGDPDSRNVLESWLEYRDR